MSREDSERPDPLSAEMESLQKMLRESESTLDFNVTTRLAAARARAMAEARRPRRSAWNWGSRWATPAMLAAALAVAIVPRVSSWHSAAPLSPAAMKTASVAISIDPLEMSSEEGEVIGVAEDLDFYQWLDETDAGA